MIPVLGVPVLNRPDLLARMVQSIDLTPERVIVVDNGGIVGFDEYATVIRPGSNLGVAASWNLILKASLLARWWVIANSDVQFAPGDMARLADHMERTGGLAMLRDMAVFALTPEVVERVGWFDEQFVNGYCEDVDYRRRCHLAGVDISALPFAGVHHTSSTIGSDHELHRQNARTYPENVSYYTDKWGGGMGSETFRTPFNRGGHVGDWRLDLDRLRRLSWRTSDVAAGVVAGAGGNNGAGALPRRPAIAMGPR